MSMVFCRECGKEIHESAVKCPQCGIYQHNSTQTAFQAVDGPLWVPIVSLILGIICVLALFDESEWDADIIFGFVTSSVASLVLGIVSINKQKNGKGMAITGVILSSIALLVLIGYYS